MNCGGNLTNCWGVTCDGLASRPGGVEILLVASCYGNQDKLWPDEPVLAPKASHAQATDQVVRRVRGLIQRGLRPTTGERKRELRETQLPLHEWDNLSLDKDSVLRRHKGTRTQIIVPKQLRPLVLEELHENMGHLEVDCTLDLARERFYWPHKQRDIEHHIAHACQCVQQKTRTLKTRAPLKPITTTSPFELIGIDFFIWRRVVEDTSIS